MVIFCSSNLSEFILQPQGFLWQNLFGFAALRTEDDAEATPPSEANGVMTVDVRNLYRKNSILDE